MFPRLCPGGGNGYVGRWSVSSRVGRRKDRASYVSSLNRHRGKVQQKVTVEHVHVYPGCQAIVGNVEAQGEGLPEVKGSTHALAHAPGATMRSADPPREPMPFACDEERPMPDARRTITGSAEGE
jgi:hypothetical protein